MRLVPYEEFASESFAEKWKDALRLCPEYDIGNTYHWNLRWWEAYSQSGSGKKELLLLDAGSGDGGTGIFPLMRRTIAGLRIVEFMGQSGGFATDYTGLVTGRSSAEARLRELLEFLISDQVQWDVVSLIVPNWAQLLSPFVRTMALYAKGIHWKTEVKSYSVEIPLPDEFDAWLQSLGTRTRRDIRQYLRIAEQSGVEFELLEGQQAVDSLETLYDLNRRNWQTFLSEESRRFMTGVVQDLIDGGEPASLALLRVHDQAVASVLGFRAGATHFLHPSGVVRKDVAGMSPGATMYAMLIRELIKNRVRTLDMSPGIEEYKLRLGGIVRPKYRILLWRRHSDLVRWSSFEWAKNHIGGALGHLRKGAGDH